jgi:serine protease Do
MVYFLILGVFMIRRSVFCFVLMCVVGFAGFGQQAAAIRDYVGMISQVFDPEITAFLERLKVVRSRQNRTEAVREIERYLKGDSGTGFVYVAPGGTNYIITNYHVISQAATLTVTFEKPDGERTRFSGLTIVAADKEMDVALLTFAEGQKPFRQGLSFLNRAVQEGDDVYSAGFPGLGGVAMVWQLGRGIISNSSVRIPNPDDETDVFGPFIQHTAQIDPGNSGGPLLIQASGVPTGYAVAGINTLTVRFRQAANFAIPMNRVQSFVDRSLRPPAEDDLTRLNAGLDAFIEGLGASKAVYPHIADYLSHACTGENVDYALSELEQKAPRTTQLDIYDRSFVDQMTYTVAWLIENNLRTKTGSMSTVTKEEVTPSEDGRYKVTFNVNGKPVESEWVNEYGNWRIRTFGEYASGDKTMIEKKKKAEADAKRLVTEPSVRLGLGAALVSDLGTAVGIDLRVHGSKHFGAGFQGIFGPEKFVEIDVLLGFYFPLPAGPVAFTPFAEASAGMMFKQNMDYDERRDSILEKTWNAIGISVKGGLIFTTSAVPGLYLQGAYQYNLHRGEDWNPPKGAFIIGLGYAFN